MSDKSKIVLLSGRFDPIHRAHIRSMQLLAKRFKKVLVVLLDYPGRVIPAEVMAQQLKEILSDCKGVYEVIVNGTHFGKIDKTQLEQYKFDTYAAGNMDVLLHINSLGVDTIWIDRPYDCNASDTRLGLKIRKLIKDGF